MHRNLLARNARAALVSALTAVGSLSCGSDASDGPRASIVGSWRPASGDFSSFNGLSLVEYRDDHTYVERTGDYGALTGQWSVTSTGLLAMTLVSAERGVPPPPRMHRNVEYSVTATQLSWGYANGSGVWFAAVR